MARVFADRLPDRDRRLRRPPPPLRRAVNRFRSRRPSLPLLPAEVTPRLRSRRSTSVAFQGAKFSWAEKEAALRASYSTWKMNASSGADLRGLTTNRDKLPVAKSLVNTSPKRKRVTDRTNKSPKRKRVASRNGNQMCTTCFHSLECRACSLLLGISALSILTFRCVEDDSVKLLECINAPFAATFAPHVFSNNSGILELACAPRL